LKGLVKEFEKRITSIEQKIEALFDSDETLSNQHKLLCSIDGVGSKTATKIIATTNAFRDFSDGRSFCCYADVAPFEYK